MRRRTRKILPGLTVVSAAGLSYGPLTANRAMWRDYGLSR
jgi:hypothetical protein